MANWTRLKQAINENIKSNGRGEITGPLLNGILNNIASGIGTGDLFIDVAVPDINPGNPDGNVFYLASTPGTYKNMGNVSVGNNELVVITNKSGSWVKKKVIDLPADQFHVVNNVDNLSAATNKLTTNEDLGGYIFNKTDNRGCLILMLPNNGSNGNFTQFALGNVTGDSSSGSSELKFTGVDVINILVRNSLINQDTGKVVWGAWRNFLPEIADAPTPQQGYEGTNKNYIWSESSRDTTYSHRTVLNYKTDIVGSTNGRLALRKSRWGDSGYTETQIRQASSSGDGVMSKEQATHLAGLPPFFGSCNDYEELRELIISKQPMCTFFVNINRNPMLIFYSDNAQVETYYCFPDRNTIRSMDGVHIPGAPALWGNWADIPLGGIIIE